MTEVAAKTFRGFGTEKPAYYIRNALRTGAKEARLALAPSPDRCAAPIVILFSRRSGSTWLIELLRNLEGVVTLQDPLVERNAFLYARRYGFEQHHYYFSETELRPCLPYLRDVLALRRGAPLDLSPLALRPVGAPQPIMKMANAPWSDRFWRETLGARVLRLIRHPVHAARSQTRYPRMRLHLQDSVGLPVVRERLTADQLALCTGALAAEDELRIRICELFVENLPAFGPTPEGSLVIHYEDLVARDFSALGFAAELDPDWRARMEARFDRPSASTTKGEVTVQVGRSRRLTPDEAAFLGDCVAAFGAERMAVRWLQEGSTD